MPPEPTQKTCKEPKPYQQKPKVPVRKDVPATSAKIIKKGCENLTLHDWMMVFTFIDQHPGMTQGDVGKLFTLH
jgi:hypothetical protein